MGGDPRKASEGWGRGARERATKGELGRGQSGHLGFRSPGGGHISEWSAGGRVSLLLKDEGGSCGQRKSSGRGGRCLS